MASTTELPSSDPLVNRFFLSAQEKADKEKGKAIVKEFYKRETTTDSLNYFRARNIRFMDLLLWSKGMQPMEQFLPFMSVTDANKAWTNMDLTQQRIAAQFVGTLVESMAKVRTYPCVKAIDDGSVYEKEQRILDALFRMEEAKTIDDLQQQSGIQLEPANVFVPDDPLMAKVYFELQDQLPKEIRFEQLLGCLLNDIQFEKVLNRKTLYDLIVLNTGATKIERLAPKQYSVSKCIANNMIYNFFMNDTGDQEISMIGEFYNLKVKDFRSKFGASPEMPDGLTEKQIFELAKLSTTKNIGTFNYLWNDTFATSNFSQRRPYDDNSILVLDCEINCGEDQYYVSTLDAFGREDIQTKSTVPYQQIKKDGTIIEQPKPDYAKIIKKNKNTWMRGVYAPLGDQMLYWGRPDIIISQYTDTAKPLSSYTINIPNNDGEYVPSLFERGMEPLKEYTLTKLKRKQLIAQVRPSGIRIDVESARNIDLGNGDTISWEEVLRIYNQTGTELWSSKGVDPLSKEMPAITNTAQDVTIQKIVELTNVLNGIGQEIRQLFGVPQYRDGSDVGDRTSGVLQEQQNQNSYNVTDYISNANNELWEKTCYKVCLLHWNDIVKEEPESKDDMLNTRFNVSIKMKSTEYEKQKIEADIQRYSQVPDAQGNPSLSLKDAMMIREIDDYKLACWYLTHTYEQNRKKALDDSMRMQQQNQQLQQQSAEQAQQQALALEDRKIAAEKDMVDFKATREKENILLQGILQVAAKDETGKIINMFLPAIQQLVPNLALPLAQQNKQMGEEIQEQQQQEEMSEQPPMQNGMPPQQGQPQNQQQAQPQMQ